jgi:hypothetical protein
MIERWRDSLEVWLARVEWRGLGFYILTTLGVWALLGLDEWARRRRMAGSG